MSAYTKKRGEAYIDIVTSLHARIFPLRWALKLTCCPRGPGGLGEESESGFFGGGRLIFRPLRGGWVSFSSTLGGIVFRLGAPPPSCMDNKYAMKVHCECPDPSNSKKVIKKDKAPLPKVLLPCLWCSHTWARGWVGVGYPYPDLSKSNPPPNLLLVLFPH